MEVQWEEWERKKYTEWDSNEHDNVKNNPHPPTPMWNSNVLYFREMVGRYIIMLYRRCDEFEYVRAWGGICATIILLKCTYRAHVLYL